jgi:hypothetical protein
MLIVFPFSKNDIHLAVPLMEWIRKLGPYPRHDLLLAYSEELSPLQRETVAMNARKCGWRTPPVAINALITHQSWPTAPNDIFRQCVVAAETMGRPWMFVEPDCTPIRRGWADMIADAYNENPAVPFMGVIDDTYVDLGGNTLHKIGEHMCGCAVYPPALRAYTMAHLTCLDAFDLAIAKDIRPHARSCPLMQDNWSTANYRWEGDRIECDPATLRVALSGRSMTRPVRPEAVFLHGCKDGSLVRLLSAETKKREIPAEIMQISEENDGHAWVFTPKAEKPNPCRKFRRGRRAKRRRGYQIAAHPKST